MNDIEYVQATESDIPTLVAYRVEFLTGLMGEKPAGQVNLLKQHLEAYLNTAIKNKTCICWLAKHNNIIVGVGAMTIRDQPGNFKNPSGRTGYIMNMYTVAAYRRKGIGSHILEKLMESGREMGIDTFELHATQDGEPVYIKSGFEKHHEPTYRKYKVTTPGTAAGT